MMRQNAAEEWTRCETGTTTMTTTAMGVAGQQGPIADLPTLTDRLRAETTNGSVTHSPRYSYGYQW